MSFVIEIPSFNEQQMQKLVKDLASEEIHIRREGNKLLIHRDFLARAVSGYLNTYNIPHKSNIPSKSGL